jgi:coatomer subunit beta'
VALACAETTYILRFSREAYLEGLNAGLADEDGVESAFEVVTDINEQVRSGQWVGDCFIYTNVTNRLNYLVGDQTYTIASFDEGKYLLGYLQRDSRVYLADKDVGVVSFRIPIALLEYETLVLRGDVEGAQNILPDVPPDQMNKVARFLDGQDYKELALEVATDPEHRFELALSLKNLSVALEIAKEADVEHKWKTVGDAALAAWDIKLAEECFDHAKDLGSLLLLHSSSSNTTGLKKLAEQAVAAGANNVAFSALWMCADVDGCIDLLVRTGRVAEAVLFSQTYRPSRTPALVRIWKEGLEKAGKGKVARLIGQPEEDSELFPEWDEYIKLEKEAPEEYAQGGERPSLIGTDGPKENGERNGETGDAEAESAE